MLTGILRIPFKIIGAAGKAQRKDGMKKRLSLAIARQTTAHPWQAVAIRTLTWSLFFPASLNDWLFDPVVTATILLAWFLRRSGDD